MNRHPSDLDPRLVAWLEEGPSSGPDQVLSSAFAQARSTGQDRVLLHRIPLQARFQTMSTPIKFAAVAVLALAVGVVITPRGQEIGAAPAPSASPGPTPAPLHEGPLAPGDYTVAPFTGAEWAPCGPDDDPCPEAARDDGIRFTFTVPDGWAGIWSGIWLASANNSGPEGAGFAIGRGGWLFSDPCGDQPPDVPVGPTVEDFVEALRNHPTPLALGEPVDVTIGGYGGKYLDLQGPSAASYPTCQQFQAWGPTFYAQGADNSQHIWVIDVDGVRVVIHGSEFPETDPQRSAELREIVESMRIEVEPPTPSPEPSLGDA